MTNPRTIAVAFLVCAALALISCAASIIFWIMLRKCRREIRRLIGQVPGFLVSGLNQNPEMIVEYLRSDANMCHIAGQRDMSDRLRGYASWLERWLENQREGEALRRIDDGYQPATGMGDSSGPEGGSGISRR